MKRFSGGIICLAALSVLTGARAEGPRTNVLFLLADDLRPELNCYGQAAVKSPNIDALAAAGVRFDRAYCQFPLCNPSRTSMLTGRYPTFTGVLDNSHHFRDAHPDWVSLPQHFKANGYATLRTGKVFHGGLDDPESWTVGAEPTSNRAAGNAATKKRSARAKTQAEIQQRRRNSDRIVVLEGDGENHGDYRAADRAIELLREYRDRPFFLTCGMTRPHSPPTAPKRFHDLYAGAKVKLPVDFAPIATVPAGFPPACLVPNGDLFIGREATPEQAQEMIRAYWASISWADWNLGRVLAELDRLALRDRTVIVFWGDHGYHLGEKGKWAKHGSLFETGARVPLIVVAPGAKGNGRSCERLVQTLDLYPTLVDLCGLPMPEGLQGTSLRPLLNDPEAAWDHPAFTVSGNGGRSVRVDRWRYAEWAGGEKGRMLIDETNDPNELKNLADDPSAQATVARLSALLRRLDPPAGKN